jgi:hypothetical protein
MSNFQNVISKVLTDADFRKRLIADPEVTLKLEGVEPNDEILEALGNATEESLAELAENFEEDKAAF